MSKDIQEGYRRGWSFTPLNGKRPILNEWQKAPRATLAECLQWATKGNIGLRTGKASGIVVIDIDSAKGGQVPSGLTPTVCVQTGGGGWHYYYKAPDVEMRNTSGALGPHVDTRGDGGQVVFVGSTHPETGELYQWAEGHSPEEVEIAPLPAWVLDKINERKAKPKPSVPVAPPTSVTGGHLAYVEKALCDECTAVANAPEGTRNDCLNSAAYKIGGYLDLSGYSENQAAEMLLAAALAAGLDHAESVKTIASGLRSGRAKPRALPERKRKGKAQAQSEPTPIVQPDDIDPNGLPFECLGYNEDKYYFFTKGTKTIISLTADRMKKAHLLRMADINQWEDTFHGNWDSAINYLIRMCDARGIFNPQAQRGRGAWFDSNHTVIHMGDHLIIDGERAELQDKRLAYFYSQQAKFNVTVDASLSDEEGAAFVALCQSLSWSNSDHAKLLAGWIALAPVCGCLDWRPHIWIVGARGTGKSTVLDRIVGAMLGDMSLRVASSTTQAGIRQELRHDALPVLFDEAEGNDQEAVKRVQNIVELARQASSETGAKIYKGTINQSATSYTVRSMFAMACIGHNLIEAADVSRFSVLTLNKHDGGAAHWKTLSADIARICTRETAHATFTRMVSLIPTIRHNARVLAAYICGVLGDQRTGDQYGALLAGYYALTSRDKLDDEGARWLCEDIDLPSIKTHESGNDEVECLRYLMEQSIDIETKAGRYRRTIGELYRGLQPDDHIPINDISRALERVGMHFEPDGRMYLRKGHSGITKLLHGRKWAMNYATYLERLPGAETDRVSRGGTQARWLVIPKGSVPEV